MPPTTNHHSAADQAQGEASPGAAARGAAAPGAGAQGEVAQGEVPQGEVGAVAQGVAARGAAAQGALPPAADQAAAGARAVTPADPPAPASASAPATTSTAARPRPSSRPPATEPTPVLAARPATARGIDALLAAARSRLKRLDARQAHDAAAKGAVLVDIRYAALRERDGEIPGALVVERNELEWRLDPLSDHRLPQATGPDLLVVVLCNEGYASSLAATALQDLGLPNATDLIGGFQAWRSAGLPVVPPT